MRKAICNSGKVLRLSPQAKYLEIDQDIFFDLKEEQRNDYVSKVLTMTAEDIENKKEISFMIM